MIVRMTDLLKRDESIQSDAMTVPIGIDKNGTPVLVDVKNAPHIMIGGMTGSGKSVMLHNIINGLISKNTPEQLQFVLIDLKRTEFGIYADLPHLACPVIGDYYEAVAALDCIALEMARRRDVFPGCGNANEEDRCRKNARPVPQIVVVIDEYAGLMEKNPRKTKKQMAAITAKGHGVGIHLIAATQRPAADFFSEDSKANIPVRMAFRVADPAFSLVWPEPGAEKLTESGEMLYSAFPSPAQYVRAAYLSASEREKIPENSKCRKETSDVRDPGLIGKIRAYAAEYAKTEEVRTAFRAALSDSDRFLLDHMEKDLLKAAVEALRPAREVLWLGDDRKTEMPISELRKQKCKFQPVPSYPPALEDLMRSFLRVRARNPFRNRDNIDTKCLYPTVCTPTEIVEYLSFLFVRERVCDGIFARGIENGQYLKMLLRLEDCLAVWRCDDAEK